jgi:hypothetical protein
VFILHLSIDIVVKSKCEVQQRTVLCQLVLYTLIIGSQQPRGKSKSSRPSSR